MERSQGRVYWRASLSAVLNLGFCTTVFLIGLVKAITIQSGILSMLNLYAIITPMENILSALPQTMHNEKSNWNVLKYKSQLSSESLICNFISRNVKHLTKYMVIEKSRNPPPPSKENY